MNTQPNYITVVSTNKETIQVLVLPPFTSIGFASFQREHYKKLAATASTDKAREFAKKQYDFLNPLNY